MAAKLLDRSNQDKLEMSMALVVDELFIDYLILACRQAVRTNIIHHSFIIYSSFIHHSPELYHDNMITIIIMTFSLHAHV